MAQYLPSWRRETCTKPRNPRQTGAVLNKVREAQGSKPLSINTVLIQVLLDGDLTPNLNPIAQCATGHCELRERKRSTILVSTRVNYNQLQSQYNLAMGPVPNPTLSPNSHNGRKVRIKGQVTLNTEMSRTMGKAED